MSSWFGSHIKSRRFPVLALLMTGVVIVALGALLLPAYPAAAEGPARQPAADDSWDRVRAAGRLVVGMSPDYPPFEFYTADFKVDGFDVALIQAVAAQLGLQVDIQDYSFDGLPAVLQVGQIDVAISAIDINAERAAKADFTQPYFIGEDGILARDDSGIAISTVGDLARYRLGVQRGSVYVAWAQSVLIEDEKMPAEQLFVYAQVDQAIADLKAGRIDLVLLDRLAALAYQEAGVRMVARGLNENRFGIMVRKGAVSLREQLDAALNAVRDSGELARLSDQYLGADQPVAPAPTPTPTPRPGLTPLPPTPTPTPSIPCNAMQFVGDLNYDDQNMTAPAVFQPGQSFSKGWRVRNTGTCTWDSRYTLAFARGNTDGAGMGGQATAIQGQVPTGATYDVYVNLVAPNQYGTFQGFWNMRDPQGQAFGQTMWVGVQVPAPAPPPPPPAGGDISFSVDRPSIRAGECSTFRWDVENVQAVFFYAQGEAWEQHGATGHEYRTMCPGYTTTYELRVIRRDGNHDVRQIQVTVEGPAPWTPYDGDRPAPGAPYIRRFESKPDTHYKSGQCVKINWAVDGRVDKVVISVDGNRFWDDAPVEGNLEHCPSTDRASYRIQAYGAGGGGVSEARLSLKKK